MKKERAKGFVAGLLVAVLALGLIGSAAATIGRRTVEVDYTDIKIELNGEKVTPVDANGNAVEPFAINGTTYLPVRAVSNALGLDVGWDGATSTVKLAGKADFREVYSQMLTVMDQHKWLEDEAERGLDLSQRLRREITSSFSPSANTADIFMYVTQTDENQVTAYGTALSQDASAIEGLLQTCKTDYLRICLQDALDCTEKLKTGYANLKLAYLFGASYLNEPTNENYDMYWTFVVKADECFDEALDGSEYNELRDTLKEMLK